MLISIAIVLVVVLLAVALLPTRKPEPQLKQSLASQSILPLVSSTPEPTRTLRQQQLDEEAAALSSEYQRRADEVWLDELRTKASSLLAPDKKATK